jgi:hypothetical protein
MTNTTHSLSQPWPATKRGLAITLAFCTIASVQTVAFGRETAAAPTLEQFSAASGLGPPPGTRLEPTVVEGVYAFRFPNNTQQQCSQYVTADLRLIANQGQKGWSHLKDRSPLSDAEQADISQRIIAAVQDKAVLKGTQGGRPAMTLIGAVDCQFSQALESELRNRQVRYRLVSGTLDPTNHRGSSFEQAFKDVRCMLGGGTPRAIFPDGRVVYGKEGILARLNSAR